MLGRRPLDPERTEEGDEPEVRRRSSAEPASGGGAGAAVGAALDSPGRALDPVARAFFERGFGINLANVRVHSDAGADAAARAVDARAFTLGNRIAFAAGEYAPATPAGRRLLAHELAHVTQAASEGGAAATVRRQTPATAPTQAPAVRQDYVFIMGQASGRGADAFYATAARFYRARHPNAIMVLTARTLTAILDYLALNVTTPAANIYIVTHGNEDGTIFFALSPADTNSRVEVTELRDRLHPAGGGSTGLASVGNAVDANTRIHIKGCDIGRTSEMVELLDESFGGAGAVTASTHEQVFGYSTARGTAARTRERTRLMGEFDAAQPALPDVPAAVDPSLRGQARTDALAERRRLVAERQAAIRQRTAARRAEERRIQPDLDRAAREGSVFEELSGPMFQRPGTTLFTPGEVRPEVDRLYGHLPEPERISLTARLTAPDRRSAAVADRQGVFRMQGQRVLRVRPISRSFPEPMTGAEASRVYGSQFPRGFRATAARSTRIGTEVATEVDGVISERGQPPRRTTESFTAPFPSDADLIAEARSRINNPDRYEWSVTETHSSNGRTTRTALGRRVVAYLHHGTLSPGPLPDFNPPESEEDFYHTSVFPPPPPPGASPTTTP